MPHQESGSSSDVSPVPPVLSSQREPRAQGTDENPSPLVTVIIPAYQCAHYIAQGIESVLAQSFKNFEIIVINDGSPDTPELEETLRPYQDQITYLKQENSGPSSARNTAMRHALGKYVAFLDGDDYWAPEHLAKSVALLESNPGLTLTYCDCFLVKNELPYTRVFVVQEQSTRVSLESLLLQSATISTSSVVAMRKALLSLGGFDENLRRCEDFDMWLRLAFHGGRITYYPDAEVYHRERDVSLSADGPAMLKDRLRVYEKASTLGVSKAQQRIIRHMMTRSEIDGYVEQLKQALERHDYTKAREAAQFAKAVERNWRLTFAAIGLKVVPRLFLALYDFRSSLLRRRRYSGREFEQKAAQ